MDVLSTKLRALQSELSVIIHEKSVVETKLIELDQLVGQLLSGKAIFLVCKLIIIIHYRSTIRKMISFVKVSIIRFMGFIIIVVNLIAYAETFYRY
jgi:hypothetical protein